MRESIQVGDQAFVAGGTEEFGAVRSRTKHGLVIYVENAGEFIISLDAVTAVHSGKVIFDRAKLEPALLDAIGHAHDAEEPGL